MMRLISFLLFTAGLPFAIGMGVVPAQAAYLSAALEANDPAQAFVAPFEAVAEDDTGPGFMVLTRDAAFGETARRVENCAAVMQARAEGFEALTQNETVYLDDWAWARCMALAYLSGAKVQPKAAAEAIPAPLKIALVNSLPAFVGEARSCEDQVAAMKASIRGESWLPFAQKRADFASPIRVQDQPPAQFDLLVAARQASTTLAVTQKAPDLLGFYFNTAAGTLERLAQVDWDGDGTDDLLVHMTWDDEIVGTYRSAVMRLKRDPETDAYLLMDQAYWLGQITQTCPDHLADVLIGPSSLRK
ncbi:MAG: hypothetical protein ACPG06_08360 [Alphaproteobacteria bacterium]